MGDLLCQGITASQEWDIVQVITDYLEENAEISAVLRLPLGAARILIADMYADGLVRVFQRGEAEEPPASDLLTRVQNALHRSRPSTSGQASDMRSVKILIAGGSGVGKTTFMNSISEITPLTTEAVMTAPFVYADDPSHVPDIPLDARSRVSAEATLITLVEHALSVMNA